MASLGRGRGGWHPPGGDTRMKFLKKVWLDLERTVEKRGRTDRKRSSLCRRRWLKKVVSSFQEKIGVTPSVAAPGDTNPSDATVSLLCQYTSFSCFYPYSCITHQCHRYAVLVSMHGIHRSLPRCRLVIRLKVKALLTQAGVTTFHDACTFIMDNGKCRDGSSGWVRPQNYANYYAKRFLSIKTFNTAP